MGKVKGAKKDAKKRGVNAVDTNMESVNDPVQVPEISGNDVPINPPHSSDVSDVFTGINISLRDLTTTMNDESKTVVSVSKSTIKGKTLNKKERRRMRRQTFLENITEHTHTRHKKKKKKSKRSHEEQEKRPPLEKISMSALLMKCRESEKEKDKGILKLMNQQKQKESEEKKDTGILKLKNQQKQKESDTGILKLKNQHKQKLSDMESIQNIWKDPAYKACPSTAVSGALQKLMTGEAEDDSN